MLRYQCRSLTAARQTPPPPKKKTQWREIIRSKEKSLRPTLVNFAMDTATKTDAWKISTDDRSEPRTLRAAAAAAAAGFYAQEFLQDIFFRCSRTQAKEERRAADRQ
ncbi:hypothetical protein F2P81_007337 [Scophthalmus maximus]|uniref:Uncharacterized protein n=1 Tax=Scophthalmus maximus TaxID=52904 RepID=A0A6A4T9A5_SCOMX|nr:hypothetical protein F2P81_007337 [Scophthalmus maximus]